MCHYGETSDKLWNHTKLTDVIGSNKVKRMLHIGRGVSIYVSEAHLVLPHASFYAVFQTDECSACDEEDVLGVDIHKRYLRMFSTSHWRHSYHISFHNLEQALLHSLASRVARGEIGSHVVASTLINFIQHHYPHFGALDIIITIAEQTDKAVLNIRPDKAGLGDFGAVLYVTGDVEQSGDGLHKKGLSAAGRSH